MIISKRVEDLAKPTVHMNGTSGAALVEQLENAVNAIRLAETALSEASPNARDYYVSGSYSVARDEHTSRAVALQVVRAELEAIWESVQDQIDRR